MKPPQSLAGYIRQHLKELEERLEVGVRQEVIVSELESHGYKTTLKGFRNFLYRARIWAAQKEQKNALSVAKNPGHKKQEVPLNPLKKQPGFEFKGTSSFNEDDLQSSASHRPSDLDEIAKQTVDLRALSKFAKRN